MQNYELILLRSDDICLDSFLSLVVNNEVVNADNSDVVGKEFCQDLVSVQFFVSLTVCLFVPTPILSYCISVKQFESIDIRIRLRHYIIQIS